MTDETTPDAVERAKLLRSALCAAASDADELRAVILAERARHAEEVARLEAEAEDHCDVTASLRGQLRKAEGERDELKRHYEEALECETESFREQLRPLEALRSLLPDVRACAEHCISCSRSGEATTEATIRILAALDSHECPECHRNSDHKMSCSRGGSKGGRFSARLDSQGGEGPSLPGEPPNGNAGPARKDKSCSK